MADLPSDATRARGDHLLCAGMAMGAAAMVMLYCLAAMLDLV